MKSTSSGAWIESSRFKGYYRATVSPTRAQNSLTIEPSLPGRFQIRNALTAATAARLLSRRGFPITEAAIERGIASARWPGRLERLSDHPAVYLDGTHNPAGARELLKFWEENFAHRRILLVYGAMRDKAVDEIAGLLFPRADAVLLTEPRQPRAVSASILAEMTNHFAKRSIVIRDPFAALEAALQMASPEDAIFATGSLYLVGELRAYWNQRKLGKPDPTPAISGLIRALRSVLFPGGRYRCSNLAFYQANRSRYCLGKYSMGFTIVLTCGRQPICRSRV